MSSKLLPFFLPVSLAIFSDATAQTPCYMSNYPYGEGGASSLQIHGTDFEAMDHDIPFLAHSAHKQRYSQFWVNADVLNVRSGPSLTHTVVSETFLGNHVFAYAKKGEWVAIRPGSLSAKQGSVVRTHWVNKNYLSATRIEEQVETNVLKGKCSFAAFGTYARNIKKVSEKNSKKLANVRDVCSAIRAYLSHQHLLSQPHAYVHEYETWRKSQNNPNDFSPAACYRLQ